MAGQWPITEEGAEIIGLGVASWSGGGTVCLGRDTRESGPALSQALVQGLIKGGSTVIDLGVVPTAAVSCFAAAHPSVNAGVMLTASHNAWHDNGIKVLDASGEKLTDTTDLTARFSEPVEQSPGSVSKHDDPLGPWRDALPQINLTGLKILFDGAHGAAFEAGRLALSTTGAEVLAVASEPNGRNINEGVGAMHPPTELHGCDIGICLDGDGDRLVLIDPKHGVLDGDDILWMLAQRTTGPVIGTVMANGGLEAALNGRLVRTGVGDAKVHAEMLRSQAPVGGEPSGHIMIKGGMPTSDGIYTALRVLETAPCGQLPVDGWTRLPQVNRSVRHVSVQPDLPAITEARNAAHRVLVRASGTEPVVRVMVEGPEAEQWAARIADTLPRASD